MPEEATNVVVPAENVTTAENTAATKKKGSQRLTCYAYADPTSIFVFDLPEKVVTYFKIDRTAPSAGDVKVYKSKTVSKAKNEKRQILGGSLRKKGRKILKYINDRYST